MEHGIVTFENRLDYYHPVEKKATPDSLVFVLAVNGSRGAWISVERTAGICYSAS